MLDRPLDWNAVRARRLSLSVSMDQDQRGELARPLDIVSLSRLDVTLTAAAWLDGVEVRISLSGQGVRRCGLSLDDFETEIKGTQAYRFVPPGSDNLPGETDELIVQPDEDDPPELLPEHGIVPLKLIGEALDLSLDPFPRKPGARFEQPETGEILSPFAALSRLKPAD